MNIKESLERYMYRNYAGRDLWDGVDNIYRDSMPLNTLFDISRTKTFMVDSTAFLKLPDIDSRMYQVYWCRPHNTPTSKLFVECNFVGIQECRWRSLKELYNQTKENILDVRVYDDTGRMLPSDRIFITTVYEYIAVAIESRALYTVYGRPVPSMRMQVETGLLRPDNPVYFKYTLDDQSRHDAYNQLKPYELSLVNGIPMNLKEWQDIPAKSYVEGRKFTDVIGRFQISLENTALFTHDGSEKYLIHIPKDINPNNEIITYDKVELFIKSEDEPHKARWLYPELTEGYIYQITHNDFAIDTDFIQGILDEMEVSHTDMFFDIVIRTRNSGKVLSQDVDYLRLLYMNIHSDVDIVNFLTENQNRPWEMTFWQADHLIESEFINRLPGSQVPGSEMSLETYSDVYGFHEAVNRMCRRVHSFWITENSQTVFPVTIPPTFNERYTRARVYIKGQKIDDRYVNVHPLFLGIINQGNTWEETGHRIVVDVDRRIFTDMFYSPIGRPSNFPVFEDTYSVALVIELYEDYEIPSQVIDTSGGDVSIAFEKGSVDICKKENYTPDPESKPLPPINGEISVPDVCWRKADPETDNDIDASDLETTGEIIFQSGSGEWLVQSRSVSHKYDISHLKMAGGLPYHEGIYTEWNPAYEHPSGPIEFTPKAEWDHYESLEGTEYVEFIPKGDSVISVKYEDWAGGDKPHNALIYLLNNKPEEGTLTYTDGDEVEIGEMDTERFPLRYYPPETRVKGTDVIVFTTRNPHGEANVSAAGRIQFSNRKPPWFPELEILNYDEEIEIYSIRIFSGDPQYSSTSILAEFDIEGSTTRPLDYINGGYKQGIRPLDKFYYAWKAENSEDWVYHERFADFDEQYESAYSATNLFIVFENYEAHINRHDYRVYFKTRNASKFRLYFSGAVNKIYTVFTQVLEDSETVPYDHWKSVLISFADPDPGYVEFSVGSSNLADGEDSYTWTPASYFDLKDLETGVNKPGDLLPENNYQCVTGLEDKADIMLQWKSVPGAVGYRIIIDKVKYENGIPFAEPEHYSGIVGSAPYFHIQLDPLDGSEYAHYQWCVEAVLDTDKEIVSGFTDYRSFYVHSHRNKLLEPIIMDAYEPDSDIPLIGPLSTHVLINGHMLVRGVDYNLYEHQLEDGRWVMGRLVVQNLEYMTSYWDKVEVYITKDVEFPYTNNGFTTPHIPYGVIDGFGTYSNLSLYTVRGLVMVNSILPDWLPGDVSPDSYFRYGKLCQTKTVIPNYLYYSLDPDNARSDADLYKLYELREYLLSLTDPEPKTISVPMSHKIHSLFIMYIAREAMKGAIDHIYDLYSAHEKIEEINIESLVEDYLWIQDYDVAFNLSHFQNWDFLDVYPSYYRTSTDDKNIYFFCQELMRRYLDDDLITHGNLTPVSYTKEL